MDLKNFFRVYGDRTAAAVLTVLAFLVLLLGYLGTSRTEFVAAQIPYLMSGGLFAIMLLTVAAVLRLSADMRDQWRELAEQGDAIRQEQRERRTVLQRLIEEEVEARFAAGPEQPGGSAVPPQAPRRSDAKRRRPVALQ